MPSRINKNRHVIYLIGICLVLSIALRLFHLTFFEFKNDQAKAIHLGNQSRQSYFMTTHGMTSGVGINNPPFFIYFMGMLTFFSQSPVFLTACILVLNILALILAVYYFHSYLPKIYCLLCCFLLAFNPAFVIYSTNIWAQSVLPIFIILFHILLYRFIIHERPFEFILLIIFTSIASQFHMSVFFLFPLLFFIGFIYRKDIAPRGIAVSIGIIIILFIPYIYHLLFEGELARYMHYSKGIEFPFYKKIIMLMIQNLIMPSIDFFLYYFKWDFFRILKKTAGPFYIPLYLLNLILILSFITGWGYYLKWLICSKKFFKPFDPENSEFPLPCQISGFLITGITILFIIFRINTYPHYLILLIPSYSILSGWVFYRLWQINKYGKLVSLSSIAACSILLVLILVFINNAGGHPSEYGPHYKMLNTWREKIWGQVPEGYYPEVQFVGSGKFDIKAMKMIVEDKKTPAGQKKPCPLKIVVLWDTQEMKYQLAGGP